MLRSRRTKATKKRIERGVAGRNIVDQRRRCASVLERAVALEEAPNTLGCFNATLSSEESCTSARICSSVAGRQPCRSQRRITSEGQDTVCGKAGNRQTLAGRSLCSVGAGETEVVSRG